MTLATSPEQERIRAKDLARKRRARAEGKEIGSIPPIENQGRRAEAEASLRRFCEIYFPDKFYLEWSEHHLRMIEYMEEAIKAGGAMIAAAMPRGWGKTALVIAAVVWAILLGLRRYVFVAAASEKKAVQIIESIKADLRHNALLRADFPASLYPIHCLEGETRRAAGQRHHGQPTSIRWLADRIIMPTIPGEPASGAIIDVAGITGDIRGRHIVGADGRIYRPDIAICDDIQTTESAHSPAQTDHRLRVLRQDVVGLAGVGQTITVLLPCTVICEGDLADTVLDPEQSPGWRSVRTGMVKRWPDDEELWEEYSRIWARSMQEHGDCRDATAFYVANRAAMDAGAEVAWEHAYRPDKGEISTLQTAQNLRLEDEDGFYAEHQNQPRRLTGTAGLQVLTASEIVKRTRDEDAFIVPPGFDLVTAGIDIQGDLLFWSLTAWRRADFTGFVMAYGTTPPQRRRYFSLRDVKHTLTTERPGLDFQAALYAELTELVTMLASKRYKSASGEELALNKGLVDANWSESTDVAYRVCRESRGLWVPSHGKGIKAADTPISAFNIKPGERIGEEWILRPTRKGRSPIRHIMFDANHWKTKIHAALATADEAPGNLRLYEGSASEHRMFADQLCAEMPVRESVEGGREVDRWRPRPGHRDNHWLDTSVLCAVSASMAGAERAGVKKSAGEKRKRGGLQASIDRRKKANP